MKRCLTLVIVKEMYTQSTKSYRLTAVRMGTVKKKITSAGEDVEKGEPSCIGSGNANWCSCCLNRMEAPQKVR